MLHPIWKTLSYFFEVKNIAEEKKVAVFLTVVGQKTHSAPKLPRKKSFNEIATLFKQQFQHSLAHHKPELKEDHPAQITENRTNASKSTDSAPSQPSGKKVNYSDKLHSIADP